MYNDELMYVKKMQGINGNVQLSHILNNKYFLVYFIHPIVSIEPINVRLLTCLKTMIKIL